MHIYIHIYICILCCFFCFQVKDRDIVDLIVNMYSLKDLKKFLWFVLNVVDF